MPNVTAALPNIDGAICLTPLTPTVSAVQYRCQDAKSVEICWGAPINRTDLSR